MTRADLERKVAGLCACGNLPSTLCEELAATVRTLRDADNTVGMLASISRLGLVWGSPDSTDRLIMPPSGGEPGGSAVRTRLV